jgi:hypothetical protein
MSGGRRFFVVPLLAGLLRMTFEKRACGWTLICGEPQGQHRADPKKTGTEVRFGAGFFWGEAVIQDEPAYGGRDPESSEKSI